MIFLAIGLPTTPVLAQSPADRGGCRSAGAATYPGGSATEDPAEGAAEDENRARPLALLYLHQAGRRADGGDEFGRGLADAVAAVNRREGGLNNVEVALVTCDLSGGADLADLLGPGGCGDAAKGALLAILWPREEIEPIVLTAERAGLPLIAPAARDALAEGGILRWSFAPPVPLAAQGDLLLRMARQPVEGSGAPGRVALFHAADGWGAEMRDVLMALSEARGLTLQAFSIRPGEAQDIVSTFRDFGDNAPDRLIVWGDGGLADAVLREAARRDYPAARIIGGFADAAVDALGMLGERAAGYRVLALAQPTDGAEPRSPLRASGQLIGGLSVEALGAAQELAGNRHPDRSDVRTALERMRLTPERMTILQLAKPSAAVGLSCNDHAGDMSPVVLRWNGSNFQPSPTPDAGALSPSLAARRAEQARLLALQVGEKRAVAPSCPSSDRSG